MTTPWGETYDDLAVAILEDKDAPDVLQLAAFLYQRGSYAWLIELIKDAIELNERELRDGVTDDNVVENLRKDDT